MVGAFYMPKTNNYIEIAVGVCRVANYTEYISQFARWPYYNLELINIFQTNYDKFHKKKEAQHLTGIIGAAMKNAS